MNDGPEFNDALNAFQLLLKSYMVLAGFNPGSTRISIENNHIIILTKEMVLGDFFTDVFLTPSTTREGLKYNLKECIDDGEVLSHIISPDIDFKTETAWDVLSHIFSPLVLRTCQLSKKEVNRFDSKFERELRIPVEDAYGHFELRQAQMKILAAAMQGAGILGMWNAYLTHEKVGINNAKTILKISSEIHQILYFEKDNRDNVFFVFNYGDLIKLLFPNVLNVAVNKTEFGLKITLSKTALLEHLFQTFPEGFILCPWGNQYKMIRLTWLGQGAMYIDEEIYSLSIPFQIGERTFVIMPEIDYFEDVGYSSEYHVVQKPDTQSPTFLPAFSAQLPMHAAQPSADTFSMTKVESSNPQEDNEVTQTALRFKSQCLIQ